MKTTPRRGLVRLGAANQLTLAAGFDGPYEVVPLFRYVMIGRSR